MGLSSNFTNITKLLSKEISPFQIFSIKHILIGIVIALVISLVVFSYNHKRKQMARFIVDAKVLYKDKESIFKALIDTGNTLRDPLSNRPVFVVELSQLQNLLPKELIDYYNSPIRTNIEDLLINLNDKFPLLLVPFKSIGSDNGIILGFKPDNVIIRQHDENFDLELQKIIIGIYEGRLSHETDFSGLLSYETIVQKEEIWLS